MPSADGFINACELWQSTNEHVVDIQCNFLVVLQDFGRNFNVVFLNNGWFPSRRFVLKGSNVIAKYFLSICDVFQCDGAVADLIQSDDVFKVFRCRKAKHGL